MLLDYRHRVVFYDDTFTRVDCVIFNNENLVKKVYTRIATYDEEGHISGYTADNTCYLLTYDTDVMTILENGTIIKEGTEEEYSEIIITLKEHKDIYDGFYIISADYVFNPDVVKDYLNISVCADKFSVKCDDNQDSKDIYLPYFRSEERNLKVNVNGGSGRFRIKNIRMMQIVQAVCENDYIAKGVEYIDCLGQTKVAQETGFAGVRSDLPAVFEMETLNLPKDTYYFDSEGNEHKAERDGNYEVMVEEVTYDNGLNYRIDKENSQIKLISKGIPFLTTQAYYVIEICHEEKLKVPTQKIQTDPSDEINYGGFIDMTEEEIADYEKDMTCRYFIKYEMGNEPETGIPDEIVFNNWKGGVKYFNLEESIIQVPIFEPYICENKNISKDEYYYVCDTGELKQAPTNATRNVRTEVDWCNIDNNRAFTISIECGKNEGCERTCFAEINGKKVTIKQAAKQFLFKKDSLVFDYDDTSEQTYYPPNSYSTFEYEGTQASWCSVVDNGSSVTVKCLSINTSYTKRVCTIAFKNDCDVRVALLEITQNSRTNEDQENVKFLKIYHEDKRIAAIFIDKEGNVMDSYSSGGEEQLGPVPDLYKNKEYQLTFHVISKTYMDENWETPITNSTISVMKGAKWLEIDKAMEYDESTDPVTGGVIISSDEDNNYGIERYGNLTFVCNSDPQLRKTITIKQLHTEQP